MEWLDWCFFVYHPTEYSIKIIGVDHVIKNNADTNKNWSPPGSTKITTASKLIKLRKNTQIFYSALRISLVLTIANSVLISSSESEMNHFAVYIIWERKKDCDTEDLLSRWSPTPLWRPVTPNPFLNAPQHRQTKTSKRLFWLSCFITYKNLSAVSSNVNLFMMEF